MLFPVRILIPAGDDIPLDVISKESGFRSSLGNPLNSMFATIHKKKNKDEWVVVQYGRLVGGEILEVAGFDEALTESEIVFHAEGSVEIVKQLRSCRNHFDSLTTSVSQCGLAARAFGYKNGVGMRRHTNRMDFYPGNLGVIGVGGDSSSIAVRVSTPWDSFPDSGHQEWDAAIADEIADRIWCEIERAFGLAAAYDQVRAVASGRDKNGS